MSGWLNILAYGVLPKIIVQIIYRNIFQPIKDNIIFGESI